MLGLAATSWVRVGFAQLAAPIVHLAFATLLAQAQRQEGSFGTMTLSPGAKKLHALMGEKAADTV